MKRNTALSTKTASGDTMTIERNGSSMGFKITTERSNTVKETPDDRAERLARQRSQGAGVHRDKRIENRRNVKRVLRNSKNDWLR